MVPGIHHASKNTGPAAVSEPDTGRSLCSFVLLFLLLASCVPLLVCCDSGDQRGSGAYELFGASRTHVFVRGGSGRSSIISFPAEYHDTHRVSGSQYVLKLR